MDKILSARVDESVFRRIGLLADELHKSKKAIIEDAILSYARKVGAHANVDPLERSFGAWQREESAEETVQETRSKVRQSLERHRR